MIWRVTHPYGNVIDWISIVQELITIQSLVFALSAIWLYVLCARIIVIYYINTTEKMKHLIGKYYCVKEIFAFVETFKYLSYATHLLHRRFGLILLVNCCYLMTNLIHTLYYITRFTSNLHIILVLWDWFTLVEVISRLFLICHMADSIRNSVSYKLDSFSKFKKSLSKISYL